MSIIKDLISNTIGESMPLPQKIREYYEKHGYEWQPENIIALRNTAVKNDNTFQDYLCIVTDAEARVYVGTTVPGTTWTPDLLKKYKVSGTGQYCLGFYPKLWTFGQHMGRAFVQVGMCEWYEDANLDKKQDATEKVYRKAYCRMDIHRTGADGKLTIDTSSAGCQNPKYHEDMEAMLNICGWVGVTPPKKLFNGLITDTESLVFAKDLMKLVRKK